MKPFRDWTIRTRLTVAMMATSIAAVLLVGAVLITFFVYRVRREHLRELHATAHLIGRNAETAIVLDMPSDAQRLLDTLAVNPSVILACIYDSDGRPLAVYRSSDAPPGLVPPKVQPNGYSFEGRYLKLFHEIEVDGRTIGTLFIQDSRALESAVLHRDTEVWVFGVILALIASFGVAQWLQHIISGPILSLAGVAETVARNRDYGVRARKWGNDEIGLLMDSFNDMLSQIQAAELALRQTEERFRDFFQQAPVGFHIFGPDRRFIDVNEAELRMIGYARDELIGQKTWADLTLPGQRQDADRHWDEIVATGTVRNVEYTLLHKDGHPVNVIVNSSALFDEEGRLVRTRGSVVDITERRQILSRLRQSQAMLKNVLDTINVCVFWKDTDLRYRGCNRLFAFYAGLSSPEDVVGKTDYDMPWKILAPAYIADDRSVIESGRPRLNYEEPQTTPEGKSIWLNASKIPLLDDAGKVTGLLGTYIDITERKRTELALRLSEQRFRAIADYTYDWELWISPQGHVLWTNPAVQRITGYAVDEFMSLGDYPAAVIREEDRPLVNNAFASAIEGGSGRQLEFRIRRKDGRPLWVSMSWQPIFDNKGVPQGHRESIEDISEKKEAELQLHESRERFRNLVESTSDWIWEIDRNNKYTYASPKIEDLLGYEPRDALGKSPFDFMPPPEAERLRAFFDGIWQAREPFRNLENINLHKDGHEVTLETSGVPVYDAYGNFTGYRGIDRDITERKRDADRLRETTRMLKLVLDSIPSRVFWKDRNGVYLGCNRMLAADAGLEDPDDIAGKTDYDLPWASRTDAYLRDDRSVIETGRPVFHIIERATLADGSLAWVETNKAPLEDADGNVIGVLGSYEDITQRRIFEDAIRAIVEGTARTTGEDFLRSLVRHLAAAISCKFVFLGEIVGPRMDRIRTLAVWSGDDYGDNFEYDLDGTPCKTVAAGQIWIHTDGVKNLFPRFELFQTINAQAYLGLSLFDSAQSPLGILAAVHDEPLENVDFARSVMSVFAARAAAELERKQAEEERERLLRILEQKNRELESIVYTSSHDLRSTVVNVQGFTAELSSTCTNLIKVLEEIPVPHERLREELLTMLHEDIPTEIKFIASSAARMDMLIAGLLKLSRLGRVRLDLQALDMNQLMQKIIDSMQHLIQETQATVRVEPLPQCIGDPDQLVQVFGNLLDNALKYRRPTRSPAVDVSGRTEEQMSIYCVADNGLGIPQRHQKNIFEVFHRLEPEGPVPGDGLGLSIVRRIVDRHGGRIWLESTPGQGSKFYVALPAPQ